MQRSVYKIYRKVPGGPTFFTSKAYHAENGELSCENQDKEIKDFYSIPGPTPLPFIGNSWRYLPTIGEYDPQRFHENYQKMHHKYGNIVRDVIIGTRAMIHLFDPRDMEVLYRNEGRYPSRLSHRALLKYRLDRQDIYNSGGLFPSNGEDWYRLRQAFQKYMLASNAVNPYVSSIHEVCEDVIKVIKDTRNSKDEVNDFQEDLYKWATECTGIITLNKRLGCIGKGKTSEEDANNLVKAAAETHESIMITENGPQLWQIYPTAAYRKLVSAQDLMADTIRKHLNTAFDESRPDGETLLENFMAIPNVDKKDVFGMILDMFLAGIDTTAYSAAYALYHLARNQDCQEKLHYELKEVLPRKSSEIKYATIKSFSYLKACVKETMRLNPVAVGTGRLLSNELVISNYRLPPQTQVVAQHQVACRQAQHFPDPLSFRPERWLRNDLAGRHNPFLVLPFGYGPRMCIGRRFAELELHLLLAKIFRNFRVEYHYGHMDCFTRLINVPDKPLHLKFVDLES